FEAPACNLVKLQNFGALIGFQAAKVAQLGFEHLLRVEQECSGGAKTWLRVAETEASHSRGGEMIAQSLAGGFQFEVPAGPTRERRRTSEALNSRLCWL